jgi:hemoglobin
MRHAPFRIGAAERDAWLAAMLAALEESDGPEVATEMMRDYFVNASTAMINAY